jgi:hypothetical protein
MTGTEEKRQARLKLLKRLIPLAVLGATVALVVGQLTRMITYDVVLTVSLTPGLANGLEKVELTVSDPQSEVVSVTVFTVDATTLNRRRLSHQLHLTAGKYALDFKFIAAGASARTVIRRNLDVTGDSVVSLNLP